jgi:hypothetical protein
MNPPAIRDIEGLVTLTAVELVSLTLLAVSVAINAVQLYRARARAETIQQGLLGLSNGIGWLQALELQMLRQMRARVHAGDIGDIKGGLQELAAHLQHSHVAMRLLQEQVVATARSVDPTDPRWAGDVDDRLETFVSRSRAW